jgi:hypothetical protein
VLAALGDHLGEQVELRDHVVEPQPDRHEPGLLPVRGLVPAWAVQPGEEALHLVAQRDAGLVQEALDGPLRRHRQARGQDHRLVQDEGLDRGQPGQQRPRLLGEQADRQAGRRVGRAHQTSSDAAP